jgi:protein TonB
VLGVVGTSLSTSRNCIHPDREYHEREWKRINLPMWLRVGCLGFLITMAVPCHAETDAVDAWKKQIVTRLNASRRFPLEARGQSGVAKVTFVLDRSGKLISRELTQSSGLPALDKEALATVGRARPFPVPPPEIDDDGLTLIVPLVFAGKPRIPISDIGN